MSEFIEIMLLPLLACLVLTGIHTFLGLHVVRRGVIFVDLALAQVAALGATLGYLLGFGLHSTGGYGISLALTSIAAGAFALLRMDLHGKHQAVPQEAIVGIVYVVASAACVLVLSQTAEGGEELKSLLVGHLLFVGWGEILKIFCIYSLVGLLHYRYRSQFLRISEDALAAQAAGMRVRLWDFLFYLSFGLVVTSSVEVGGVLLVFSYLIVPAVCASILQRSFSQQLVLGWLLGLIVSVLGMLLSYRLDLPTGATIVCVFGAAAFVCLLGARWLGVGRGD